VDRVVAIGHRPIGGARNDLSLGINADGYVSDAAGFPNPYQSMVESIEFDPAEPDHLFIGTGGEGARYIKSESEEMFHSVDCGDTWEQIPLRFPIIYTFTLWRFSKDNALRQPWLKPRLSF
jgi:hypothetical protein